MLHPHQSRICTVCGGAQPCGRKSAAGNRMGATSRPHVQQASARRGRWRAASSRWVGHTGGGLLIAIPSRSAPRAARIEAPGPSERTTGAPRRAAIRCASSRAAPPVRGERAARRTSVARSSPGPHNRDTTCTPAWWPHRRHTHPPGGPVERAARRSRRASPRSDVARCVAQPSGPCPRVADVHPGAGRSPHRSTASGRNDDEAPHMSRAAPRAPR